VYVVGKFKSTISGTFTITKFSLQLSWQTIIDFCG